MAAITGLSQTAACFTATSRPGHYHIAPVSYNRDFNQDRDVDIAPGQQLYIKILSSQSWDGACRNCVRDTFYAWVIPQEVAQAEIARGHSGI